MGFRLAWAAHELRSPIASTRLALEHLAESAEGLQSSEREMLTRCAKELRRLGEATQALLHSGSIHDAAERSVVDGAALVSEAIDLTPSAERARVRLLRKSSGAVVAAAVHLRSAIRNVIGNALAYSDGRVYVIVERIAASLVVTVKDEGAGVAAEDCERIFVRGARADEGDRDSGGQGLGLYVSRCVVEAHGGRIGAVPSPDGGIFRITLPLETAR